MTKCTDAVSILALAAGLLTGCGQGTGDPAPGPKKPRLVVVSLVKPEMRDLAQTTTQPATVHALQQAEIQAKVSGYLAKLNVDIGQTVVKDAPLAVIAVPEMERALESQQAEIDRLKAVEARRDAEKSLATARLEAARPLKTQADAQVRQAVAQLNADRIERDRVKTLVAAKTVASDLLVEAEKRYQSSAAGKVAAESTLTSAAAQVKVAVKQETVAHREWDAAKKETVVAEKKLAEMKELMNFATLKAPFKGVITERNIDKGDLIRNIQTASETPRQPLLVVSDVSSVRVHVAVPENAAPLVKVGAKVVLTLRSLPGRRIDATVTRMSRTLDERTRTMLVEIVVPNPKSELLPGMYGEATITLKQKQQALMLPAGAVRFDKEGNAGVYVLGTDDTVRIVSVKTGIDRGEEIEITDGVKIDDRIVGPLIGRLQAGQKVRVKSK